MKTYRNNIRFYLLMVLGVLLCVEVLWNLKAFSFESKKDEDAEFFIWLANTQGVDLLSDTSDGEKVFFQKLANTDLPVSLVALLYQNFTPKIDPIAYQKSPLDYEASRFSSSGRSRTILQPAIGRTRCSTVEYFFKISAEDEGKAAFLRVSVFAEKKNGKWQILEFSRTPFSE